MTVPWRPVGRATVVTHAVIVGNLGRQLGRWRRFQQVNASSGKDGVDAEPLRHVLTGDIGWKHPMRAW